VPPIGADATVGMLIRYATARSLAEMLRHDPGVRLGEDPEDVHQFRVGTPRLRSDLRTFAPARAAESRPIPLPDHRLGLLWSFPADGTLRLSAASIARYNREIHDLGGGWA
jgi:hypothetical protein